MRTKTPRYVNKDSRIILRTTDQRLLADIADKNQKILNALKEIGEKLSAEKPAQKKPESTIKPKTGKK